MGGVDLRVDVPSDRHQGFLHGTTTTLLLLVVVLLLLLLVVVVVVLLALLLLLALGPSHVWWPQRWLGPCVQTNETLLLWWRKLRGMEKKKSLSLVASGRKGSRARVG